MNVILFGATGMIGQGVLRECLLDPGVDRVLSVGRRPSGAKDAKLREIVHADLTDLSAVDLTMGTPLQRSPHYTASGNLTWAPAPNESLGFSIVYVGDRFDSPGEVNPMSSYTTANVFGSYPVYGNFSLFARVENVFDEHYEPVLGYGAEGRSAFAGVRITL